MLFLCSIADRRAWARWNYLVAVPASPMVAGIQLSHLADPRANLPAVDHIVLHDRVPRRGRWDRLALDCLRCGS